MTKKIIIILLLIMIFPFTALAWDDCINEQVDCEYPGDCARYIDTDNDGICDHSQPAPEDREPSTPITTEPEEDIHDLITGQELKNKTVSEIANIYSLNSDDYAEALSNYYNKNISITDSFQLLHDNHGIEPNEAKDIAVSLTTGEMPDIKTNESKNEGVYHLIPISLLLIILYIISHILSKKKVIKLVNHRKIWNILLLITFLISGLLGLLLVIRINFGIGILLPFNILFWHVEFGIAMAIISIFHTIWHWPYFKAIFRIK